jgi:hypothetical protein
VQWRSQSVTDSSGDQEAVISAVAGGFGEQDAESDVVFEPINAETTSQSGPRWSVQRPPCCPTVRPLRGRLWRGMTVALTVATAVVAVALMRGQSQGPRTAARPAPTPAASETPSPHTAYGHKGRPVEIGAGSPVAIALKLDDLYVQLDHPSRLVALDPIHPSTRVVSRNTPARPRLMLIDEANNRVWVISDEPRGGSRASAYDAATLASTTGERLPFTASAGAVLDGVLYLAGPRGVFQLPMVAGRVRLSLLPGSLPQVRTLAPDRFGHRLVATALGVPASVQSIPVAGGRLFAVSRPLTGRVSVAVAGAQIWIAGDHGRQQPTVLRLDAATLAALNSGVVGSASPSVVWPGDSVVWISQSSALSCVDAVTGAVAAQWPGISGQVVSTGVCSKTAFAIDDGKVIALQPAARMPRPNGVSRYPTHFAWHE